ncbi:hypothetical protein [Kangiella sp. HZ709]|uniref:hypothetical protein n=1 Tax=Kangiella sp. HZ709 TaxID=2666328 RepID=UPI0012B07979|nr:hypothetical protein [Kangiella sp. HZ709]MRX26627.1 hypothetical protein [Kangiella sp. HZ709]
MTRYKSLLFTHSIYIAAIISFAVINLIGEDHLWKAIIIIGIYNFILSIMLVLYTKELVFFRVNVATVTIFLVWLSFYWAQNDGFSNFGLGLMLLAIGFSLLYLVWGTFDFDVLLDRFSLSTGYEFMLSIICRVTLLFGSILTGYELIKSMFNGFDVLSF